jgi:hypothetical protein
MCGLYLHSPSTPSWRGAKLKKHIVNFYFYFYFELDQIILVRIRILKIWMALFSAYKYYS